MTDIGANVIVVDAMAMADPAVVAQAAELHERGIRVRTLSQFYDEWLGKLPLSELERGTFELNLVETDLAPLVRHAVDEVRIRYPGIPIAAEVPDGLLCVADGPRIGSVVRELRSGDGSGAAGPLRLHFGLGALKNADYVRIVWPDDVLQSEGWVPADQQKLIEEFQRKGVRVQEPPNEGLPGLRSMTLADPDGNKLHICTRLPHWRR